MAFGHDGAVRQVQAQTRKGSDRAHALRRSGLSYWDSTEAVILDVPHGDTTPLIDEIDFVFDGFLCASKVRAVARSTFLVVNDDGMSTVEYSAVSDYTIATSE